MDKSKFELNQFCLFKEKADVLLFKDSFHVFRRGNVVAPRNVNQGLLHFLEKQIKNLETELECPVCLQPSEVPIYTCSEQHIICAQCWKKISSASNLCPSCRAPFQDPPVKHR